MFIFNPFKCRAVALYAALFAACSVAFAQNKPTPVFRVDGQIKTGMGDGKEWRDAYSDLQRAIDNAANAGGGEVWVKTGVYKPAGSDRGATFNLKPGVRVLGGFRGEEETRSERNPKANRTVLNGDIGANADETDNCYHVVTGATDSTLDGFTISRGQATGIGPGGTGGAVFIPTGTRKMSLANCVLEKNTAGWQGGALYGERVQLTVSNCVVSANAAANGGGMGFDGSSTVAIIDSAFAGNQARSAGGAVHLEGDTKVSLKNCRFNSNAAQDTGGAVQAEFKPKTSAALEIASCIFTGNRAEKSGGALYVKGGCMPLLTDCRITHNTAFKGAGGIAVEGKTAIVIDHCKLENNRGKRGITDIYTANGVKVIKDRATVASHKMQEPAPEEVPEKIQRRTVADAPILDTEGASGRLYDQMKETAFSVIVLGDLTDPEFIKNYRNIEALANDYASASVRFVYLYRALTHPENNGYIEPFNPLERARQAQLAHSLLKTRPDWFCDGMDNAVLSDLTAAHPTHNVLICDARAEEYFTGKVSEEILIRKALADLVGPAPTQTTASRYPSPRIPAKELAPPNLFDRIHFNPTKEIFSALKTEPQHSAEPCYAKLRAEADEKLLESGNGRLYLGFHLDPLYKMQWDDRAEAPSYRLVTSTGIVSPSVDSAEEIRIEEYDNEPREFMVTARQLDLSKPLMLQVSYTVCAPDQNKSIPVTQRYIIHLETDPVAGAAFRRQIPHTDPKRTKRRYFMPGALRSLDSNGDGRLSRGELSGNLWSRFPEIDTDHDGYLSAQEYNAYRRSR